jgi:hypothetical protein
MIDGGYYPAKYTVALAHEVATGSPLSWKKFRGGKETNEFLRARGFTVRAMLRLIVLYSGVLALSLFPPTLLAKPVGEGEPGYGIDLLPTGSDLGPGGVLQIVATTWSVRHPGSAVGDARILIPSEVQLEEGQTDRTVHPGRGWRGKPDKRWMIGVRLPGPGRYEFRGLLRIQGVASDEIDEAECVLAVEVQDGRIEVVRHEGVRFERLEGPDRFRYAGTCMVAIDGPEEILPGDISSRPVLISSTHAVCQACAPPLPRVVRVIVTVGVDGRVRWVRPPRESDKQIGPEDWAAVVSALQRFEFRPAESRSRRIADWAAVDVSIVPGD